MSQYFLVISLITFYLTMNVYVAGENWLGNYKWTSKCSQKECCCFVNDLTITQVKDDPKKLSIVTSRSGPICPAKTYENVIDVPEGSFMDQIKPRTLIWVINQNSTAIAAVDYQFMECTSEAIRVTNSDTAGKMTKFYVQWVVERLLKLNLFEKQTEDEQSKQNQIISTRVYIIILPLLLLILTLFISLQSDLNTIRIQSPKENDYKALQLKYLTDLQCPCKQISNTYDRFVTIIPQYHEICSSDFVSQKWIDYLFYENTSYFFQLDFRHDASARFQILRTLCQQAQQSISDHLSEYYSFELITNEALPTDTFHIQIDSFVQLVQKTTPSPFQNLLQIIRQTTISNGVLSAIDASFVYAFHPSGPTTFYLDNYYYYEVESQQKNFDCYCDNVTMCALPEGIYGDLIQYNYPGSNWINDPDVNANTAMINATFFVDGSVVSCKPIESLMRSTIECLYDQVCLNRIGKYINYTSVSIDSFHILNQSNAVRNQTIEILTNNLFLENWIINKSYSKYFDSCQPLFCQYKIDQKQSFVQILATVISLYGGLRIVLLLIIPIIIKFILRKRSTEHQASNVSKLVRLYTVCRSMVKHLIKMNIFTGYSTDEHVQKNGRLSTKLYFVISTICLFAFAIRQSVEKQTHTKFIYKPTKLLFESLQNQSNSNFECPCFHISVKYGDFIQFNQTYHQICSSVFASNLWYDADNLWNTSDSCYYPSFPNLASFYFSLLLTFCQSANETISNSLAQFYASEYITSNIIQEDQFNNEIISISESFQTQLQNSFRQQWNLLQSVLSNNQIFTVRKTNFLLTGKLINDTVIPQLYLKNHSNCTCATNSTCYETVQFCIGNQQYFINGLRLGCYLVESLFLSTTECFYDQTCIDTIKSYIMKSTAIYSKLNVLNKSLPSLYKTDDSIETIVKNLFIEKWNELYSYEMYFNRCEPLYCTYTISQSPTFIYILARLIGVYGGLTLILKIFIPNIIDLVKQKRRQYTATSIWSRICVNMISIKRRLIHLNLFRDHSTDDEKIRKQILATRFYSIIFIIILFLLVLYSSFTSRSIMVNISLLNFDHYEHLQKQYSDSLTCPCSQISIAYNTFVNLNITYHEVCSSDFVSQQWFDYLFDSSRINDRDFRATASAQFQSLGSLCKTTQEAVNAGLTQFYSNKLISGDLIPNQTFQNRINSLITIFQKSTSQSFKRTLHMTHEIIHGNFYMSGYQTSWKFTILERANFSPIYTNPITYNSCSCGTSSSCSQPVTIDNSIIDGLLMGCYPMQTVLQSSLQCFYNQTCLQVILSYFQKSFDYNVSFQILSPNRLYRTDEKVEQMVDRLFIDQWTINRSYENYYDRCAATLCTYSYIEHFNIFYISTTILGVYSGLTIVLRILIPFLVRIGFRLLCKRRIHAVGTFHTYIQETN
ncbi:unnamed protein product [Adineta ricciae]|uniref:Uncharacterized protein n=2 Tax=Adineta ricciae TaxID=249248 RepID=A0A815LPF4_ADIRI|nr:unnamed protein product [Adineta ricciae]